MITASPTAAVSNQSRHALLDEVLAGLHSTPKRVSPRWFYDERGSELFEQICKQPEYYLTRVELSIMREHAGDMASRIGRGAVLIELGSGSGLKTRLLLDHMEEPAAYVPIDISKTQLMEAAGQIARDYPALRVRPLCADFTHAITLPFPVSRAARRAVYFPGSTIGNFEPEQAAKLLQRMRELAHGGPLLIGVDLQKDVELVERAYNDAQGVTAAFNLNLLRHLNRSLDAHFDVQSFRHHAFWNAAQSRIEMHLISRREQIVKVAHSLVRFAAGEPLVTEYSHKYTCEAFAQIARRAGLRVVRIWTDAQRLFSVQMLEEEPSP